MRHRRLLRPLLRVLLALLALCALLASPRALPADAPPAARQPLRVVMDDNYPPYTFRDANGTLNGYLVDLWAEWSQRTGIKVDLVATHWAEAQKIMAAGNADVIDTIFQTPERERTLDFSPPYAKIPVAIFNHVSIGGITNIRNLRGFLVGVKAGDACIDELAKAGITTIDAYPSYETLIKAAAAGRVRVFCLDEPPANYLLYRAHLADSFHKAFELYTGSFHRAVHRGDTDTLALVDRGFNAIDDATLRKLHDKWMGGGLGQLPYVHELGYALLIAVAIGTILALWSITLQRRVRLRTQQLETQHAHLRKLIETIPDLVWLKDPQGVFLLCNPVFERLCGAPESEIVGKTDYDFVPKELANFFLEQDRKAMLANRPTLNEEWLVFAADQYRGLFETIKSPVRDAEGKLLGVLGIARDITHRKAAEDEIRQLAFYDSLTQLPNRRLLLDRLQHALAASARNGLKGALLFIDLDNFKFLNDAQGHDSGDLLLCAVARRLIDNSREGDTVARFGGDEFVVLLEELAAEIDDAVNAAELIGERILDALSRPYELDGRSHHSSSSIGITLFGDEPGGSADDLLRRADMAMYQAKAAGRNTLRFFDPDMQAAVTARTALDAELRQALRNGEFHLHYQPQIDADNGITGAEALLRWQHPQRGLVAPGDFITLAEESGLILPLGQWVLHTACKQLRQWSAQPALVPLSIAVNVSARQFRQPDFVAQVLSALDETGADPQQLKLELTESMLLDDVEDVIAKMAQLRARGVHFSLDDFGTGYSSLGYLKRLPLSQLKIDQSFVRDVLTDPHDAAIAAAIVALADSLGLRVIAEGVETEDQRAFLAAHGCRAYQGYLFSPPLPVAEFERFATTPRQR